MSHTSAYPPRRNRRVSRRVFLHSTSVIPAALASSELLRPPARTTMPRADLDGEAVEACESRLPLVADVPLQPLVAQVTRLIAAAEYLGAPLPPDHQRELEVAFKATNEQSAVMSIQRVLDCHCLVGVEINPEMRVKVAPGPAKPELVEHGWRQFLVKVHNAGRHDGRPPRDQQPGAAARRRDARRTPKSLARSPDVRQPAAHADAERARLEYRIMQLYSRDAGKREAKLTFNVGQGTQDLGFRNEVRFSSPSGLRNGAVARARRNRRADGRGLRHSRRAGPRLSVAGQAARAGLRVSSAGVSGDGEIVKLPAGTYTVEFSRGPESITKTQQLTVVESASGATGQNGAGSERELSNRALDRSREVRLVVGRSSHPRRGLRALHEPD